MNTQEIGGTRAFRPAIDPPRTSKASSRRIWVRAFDLDDPTDTPKTFAEVISRLETQDPPHPYADHVKCAFNRMCDVFGKAPGQVPTDPVDLRKLIADAVPAAVPKMTSGRWTRIRSLVTTHLRKSGIEVEPGRDVGGHGTEWSALLEGVPKPIQLGLSRFASYCTRNGIKPANVTEATFNQFETCLRERSLKEKHEAVFRNAVRRWNDAVGTVAGWPQATIPLQRHARYFSQPWTDFPVSYVADVEAFLTSSAEEDIWAEDYKARSAPSTISLRRRQLLVLSSLLVRSGFPIEDLTSLSVLIMPENAFAALKVQEDRKGLCRSLEQLVWLLSLIADDWVKNSDHAAELRKRAKRISKKLSKRIGMSERNLARLRQFDVPANMAALLNLPYKVFAEARASEGGNAGDPRRLMLAFAVEMLLFAALRGGNLTALELDRHFVVTGRGRCQVRHLHIAADEMKGPDDLEMAMPSDTSALMDEYLNLYWPRLAPTGSAYLFPNRFGQKRAKSHFAQAISAFVREETGLIMHVHLFRHFAVKLYLAANPGDMETPRQFLRHRSDKVTRSHYTESQSSIAQARYHQTLAEARSNLRLGF
jgi:integrase